MKVLELVKMLSNRAADAEVIIEIVGEKETLPRLYKFEVPATDPRVVILTLDERQPLVEFCDFCKTPLLEGESMTAVEMGYAGGRAHPECFERVHNRAVGIVRDFLFSEEPA